MRNSLLRMSLCVMGLWMSASIHAQSDSILFEGGYRNFIVHLPTGYNPSVSYPLVLSFHGLTSNAFQQQLYTGMDAVADTGGFILVYPNGINSSWNVNEATTPHDIDFTSSLIDSLSAKYSINPACVYACGMSNGGFFSYLLACRLSHKLAAIASITGNMLANFESNCTPVKGMPVMEIHGTSDPVVSYNGGNGILSTPETVKWWVDNNLCDTTAIVSSLPDINTTDGSTVEVFRYLNGKDNSEVVHYRVNNGGHTWPGGTLVVPFVGSTNMDFSASTTIWNFFKSYCSVISSTEEVTENYRMDVYPNPASSGFQIKLSELPQTDTHFVVYDALGRIVMQKMVNEVSTHIQRGTLNRGIYFWQLERVDKVLNRGKIVLE
ncbi:MAG: T9SS type A sorting domain-containing protein [Bacteroidetes bacterium]|nr:T9SS type A sorting domain-containing protein [Bacteroidota bacterium]